MWSYTRPPGFAVIVGALGAGEGAADEGAADVADVHVIVPISAVAQNSVTAVAEDAEEFAGAVTEADPIVVRWDNYETWVVLNSFPLFAYIICSYLFSTLQGGRCSRNSDCARGQRYVLICLYVVLVLWHSSLLTQFLFLIVIQLSSCPSERTLFIQALCLPHGLSRGNGECRCYSWRLCWLLRGWILN